MIAAPNRLEQRFNVDQADTAWVTDITYIRTYEGWLYLAVVIDLYSRAVVGWSMKSTMATEIVLDALLMAVWRRFSNLKKERVRRKIYATREEARSDIFDYIEVFYNRKRRHSRLNQMSPLAFEQQQFGS